MERVRFSTAGRSVVMDTVWLRATASHTSNQVFIRQKQHEMLRIADRFSTFPPDDHGHPGLKFKAPRHSNLAQSRQCQRT
ncbi:hypothetical protein PT2222_360045 [Paraburkholderia tropica]